MLTIYNKNVSFDRSNQNMFFDSLGYGVLTDLLSDPLITEELNGSFILEFEYKKDGKLSEYLVEENIIKANGQPFSIYSINKNTTDRISVLARHWVLNEWDKDFLVDVAPTNLTANNALLWLQQRSVNLPNIVISGNCETVASARYVRKTMLEAIFKEDNALLKRFGGELSYAANNVYISTRRGSASGLTIRQGKNLSGAEYYLDFTTVTTRLLPVGKDGLTLPNLFVDSPLIGNYATPIIRKVEVDTEDVNELESFCNELYDNGIDKPTVSIKIDFIELSKTIEYQNYSNLEAAHLGDTVNVYIPDLNLNVSTRIVKTVYNDNLNRITAMELGSIMPNIVTSNADIQTKISQLENSKATILDEAKETASELIKHPFAGYIYIDDTTGSLYIMDTNDINTAQNVWKWGLGGLGFSSTGINGTYGIAITQDGRIVADYILTGTLSADRIEGYNQLLLVVSSHDDQIREITTPTSTSSGSSISLNDSADAELIDFELEGKTEQETRSGKNLLNINGTRTAYNSIITSNDTGFNAVSDGNVSRIVFPISVIANQPYRLSFDFASSGESITSLFNIRIRENVSSGSWVSNSTGNFQVGHNSVTITPTVTGTYYLWFYFNSSSTAVNYNVTLTNIQFEVGTEETPYEHYGVQPSPDYPSELVNVGYENLFDKSLIPSGFEYNNGVILTRGDGTYRSVVVPLQKTLKAGRYTINYKIKNSNLTTLQNCNFYIYNGATQIAGTYISPFSITFNVNNDFDRVRFVIATAEPASSTITFDDIILTKGAKTNEYIPYGKYGIGITNTSKNLFSGFLKGYTIGSANGLESFSNTSAITNFIPVDFIRNTNYRISGLTNTLTTFVGAYNKDKQFLGRTGATHTTNWNLTASSFTNGTPAGTGNIAYLRIRIYEGTGDTSTIDDIDNLTIQLETGNTITTYVEHKENSQLYVLDESLRAIGDYKDRLFIQNGVLYVERKIESIILNGSENYGYASSTNNVFYIRKNQIPNFKENGSLLALSNNFKNNPSSNITANTSADDYLKNGEFAFRAGSNQDRIYFKDTSQNNNVDNFTNWLSTHNTEVQYILAESTIEEIGQVDIPSTYKGITHINTTDELEPNMNITYVRDTALGNYVEEQFNSAKTIEERHYAELKISDSEIIANVNATLTNYSTTTEMNAAITLKANEINQVVSTKVGNDEVISKINQSSESITINANKLNLQGYITATDLSTSGSTIINGSNITTGTIDASTVSVANINASNITSGTISTNRLSSDVITTSNFSSQSINADKITSGTINASRIASSSITSGKLNISSLSSISGNLGTITSGLISNNRAKLDLTNGILNIFNADGGSMILSNAVRLSATAGVAITSNSNGNISAPAVNLDLKACSGATAYLACMNNANGTSERSAVECANGTLYLRSTGAIYANGVAIGGSSSKATKKNIKDLTNKQQQEVVELLKNIPLKQYDYKKRYGKPFNYGFIIEDIETTKLKDLLHISQVENNKDIKTYSTEDLVRLELIAIQQLIKRMKKLEEKLEV